MNQSFRVSFKHAYDGIRYCVRAEKNFRVHLVCTFYALFFAAMYELPKVSVLYLFLLCGSVLACEMLNTAIERIVNMQAKNFDMLAKAAKDIASGAVFLLALVAVVSGAVLFYDPPKIREIILFFVQNSVYGLLFLLSLALSFVFIFKKR